MSGRLVDVELEAVSRVGQSGRLVGAEMELLYSDPLPPKNTLGPGGWGFIPIGRRVDRSVYIDTYEDEY